MSSKTSEFPLVMTYAGGFALQLGFQMYSGAVPAIAELVANAWDADASWVKIEIPLGTPLDEKSTVTVEDDGYGLRFDEVNPKYLVIGRNKREDEGERSPKGRVLMARKGIGKLSGFGFAGVIRILTMKDGELTEFEMDLRELHKLPRGKDYHPKLLRCEKTKAKNGTKVALCDLKSQRAINESSFRTAMARRFAVLSAKFRVLINGKELKREEIPFEFRYPALGETGENIKEGCYVETIKDCGEIKWWVGFQEDTIKDPDSRGISVLARGKLVEEPGFFGLAGGAWGQFGKEYMTGEILADFLDAEVDLIATNRRSILWDDTRAAPLKEWAENKIKRLCEEWAERRAQKRVEDIEKKKPSLVKQIEALQPRERKEVKAAVRNLSKVQTIGTERLAELSQVIVDAYKEKAFVEAIREMSTLDPESQVAILSIFKELDVLEAVRFSPIVKNRLETISKLEEMIEAKVPERPDMQQLLAKYPWLLNPTWMTLSEDETYEKLLREKFGTEAQGEEAEKRPDFVCLSDSERVVVVEIKRPGVKVGYEELSQIEKYVYFLRAHLEHSSSPENPKIVWGYLIAGSFSDDSSTTERIKTFAHAFIYTKTWMDLLRSTKEAHKDFLDVVKSRAPPDDPRILELETI